MGGWGAFPTIDANQKWTLMLGAWFEVGNPIETNNQTCGVSSTMVDKSFNGMHEMRF